MKFPPKNGFHEWMSYRYVTWQYRWPYFLGAPKVSSCMKQTVQKINQLVKKWRLILFQNSSFHRGAYDLDTKNYWKKNTIKLSLNETFDATVRSYTCSWYCVDLGQVIWWPLFEPLNQGLDGWVLLINLQHYIKTFMTSWWPWPLTWKTTHHLAIVNIRDNLFQIPISRTY